MPESQNTEWKERWRDEYLAQVCGFANAQGDALVIGHTWNSAPLPGVTPDDPPRGWTEQTLLQPHISLPHNPDVANAFFRAGEIEAWGRGIERIFAACRAEHAPEPTLKLHSDGLWLEFPYDPAYLRRVKQGSNKAAEQVTDPVTDPVTNPVPPEITRVLELLTNEAMPPSVIQQRLGLKHRPTFRANYLHPALAAGLIEMTLPDKPNSRLQKYRLTEAGRRALNTRKGAV